MYMYVCYEYLTTLYQLPIKPRNQSQRLGLQYSLCKNQYVMVRRTVRQCSEFFFLHTRFNLLLYFDAHTTVSARKVKCIYTFWKKK